MNEDSIKISCDMPKFDEFACMHKDKWVALAKILNDARIPKKTKTRLLLELGRIHKMFKKAPE